MMINKTKIIMDYLNEIHPNVGCELNYSKDYELLVAVVLSAQTTDKKVNEVTKTLFSVYPSVDALADANVEDIGNIIHSIGLYKAKAKNVVCLCKDLRNFHDGKVPNDKLALMRLPGVGNKTASVVRLELFKEDELPVDTHVARIAKRLGYAKEKDDVLTIENKLKKAFPKDSWGKLHHQLIHFGRNECKAINPNCENCKIKGFCKEFK